MPNKQNQNIENNTEIDAEIMEPEIKNPCLDFEAIKLAIKYHEAMPQAIRNIVALIDELETSGVGYVAIDELKETFLKSFK